MSNSKIKITEPGWDGYNGDMGGVEFVDGVSVREITVFELARIASSISVVSVDSGLQVGDQVTLISASLVPMEVRDPATFITPKQAEDLNNPPPTPPVGDGPKAYTGDELLKIADEKGINGLREIGNERGVKGRAIPELITNLLQHQEDNGIGKPAEVPAA